MKFKTTQKEIFDGVARFKLYYTSNTDIIDILSYIEPVAYIMNERCKCLDVYRLEGYYINCGYGDFVGNDLKISKFKNEIETFKELRFKHDIKISEKTKIARGLILKICDYNFMKLYENIGS